MVSIAQDSIPKKWQFGLGIGVQTVQIRNVDIEICTDRLRCNYRPPRYTKQYSRSLSMELAYQKNKKVQYFIGFEGNKNNGFNNAYIYDESGIVDQALNFSETYQYRYSMYLGSRRFTFVTKKIKPFYGFKIAIGNDGFDRGWSIDPTLINRVKVSVDNIHVIANGQIGFFAFKDLIRINLDIPIINYLPRSIQVLPNGDTQVWIPGDFDVLNDMLPLLTCSVNARF